MACGCCIIIAIIVGCGKAAGVGGGQLCRIGLWLLTGACGITGGGAHGSDASGCRLRLLGDKPSSESAERTNGRCVQRLRSPRRYWVKAKLGG